ncbi:unnamed protein product [Prorocentrum cordatum]|uniref:Uncharacterized protein n=1 Tax=Prorocentrum cordatum TaxID=2364126 RepID=A0ABN9UNC8_9DINO|nr:unnamed protein product [Polarella glacialis]
MADQDGSKLEHSLADQFHGLTELRSRRLDAESKDSVREGAEFFSDLAHLSERMVSELRSNSELVIVEGGHTPSSSCSLRKGSSTTASAGWWRVCGKLATIAQEKGAGCAGLGWRCAARRAIADGVRSARIARSLAARAGSVDANACTTLAFGGGWARGPVRRGSGRSSQPPACAAGSLGQELFFWQLAARTLWTDLKCSASCGSRSRGAVPRSLGFGGQRCASSSTTCASESWPVTSGPWQPPCVPL